MSTVIMHNVVSVDGFIADAKDQVGPLFDWYANGPGPPIGTPRGSTPFTPGSVRRDPGQPGAAPALPSPPLAGGLRHPMSNCSGTSDERCWQQ